MYVYICMFHLHICIAGFNLESLLWTCDLYFRMRLVYNLVFLQLFSRVGIWLWKWHGKLFTLCSIQKNTDNSIGSFCYCTLLELTTWKVCSQQLWDLGCPTTGEFPWHHTFFRKGCSGLSLKWFPEQAGSKCTNFCLTWTAEKVYLWELWSILMIKNFFQW
jgi:hypothetical protein